MGQHKFKHTLNWVEVSQVPAQFSSWPCLSYALLIENYDCQLQAYENQILEEIKLSNKHAKKWIAKLWNVHALKLKIVPFLHRWPWTSEIELSSSMWAWNWRIESFSQIAKTTKKWAPIKLYIEILTKEKQLIREKDDMVVHRLQQNLINTSQFKMWTYKIYRN